MLLHELFIPLEFSIDLPLFFLDLLISLTLTLLAKETDLLGHSTLSIFSVGTADFLSLRDFLGILFVPSADLASLA